MHADPSQLESSVARCKKLDAVVKRLSKVEDRRPGLNRDEAGWKRTLAMVADIGRDLLRAASEGELRGSLAHFCDDDHAHALAQMAQARVSPF